MADISKGWEKSDGKGNLAWKQWHIAIQKNNNSKIGVKEVFKLIIFWDEKNKLEFIKEPAALKMKMLLEMKI